MGNYNFTGDLKGVIGLVSDNLYSSDKVFLRELLQKGVDAMDVRKKVHIIDLPDIAGESV
ncbi:MAG: hypothetical protein HFJ08_13025 [Lachnospiraceae bacterium]|jgi:molecular chaperone HtpG|nr:hypothetical protein [Lachnospiraceae bacterium]MCX4375704.1 hypothetical protein [Lachnospiraceae bacterium]